VSAAAAAAAEVLFQEALCNLALPVWEGRTAQRRRRTLAAAPHWGIKGMTVQ
jgi:hypothetical protein